MSDSGQRGEPGETDSVPKQAAISGQDPASGEHRRSGATRFNTESERFFFQGAACARFNVKPGWGKLFITFDKFF